VKQAHTDLETLNHHEQAYLATYVQEQSELRTSVAAVLEKTRALREEHTLLLEQHRLALEVIEGPLRAANLELEEAFAKMYALKEENEAQLQEARARHEKLLAAYTAAHSPATQPLTPAEYSQLLHSILLSKSPQGKALPPPSPRPHLHALDCAILVIRRDADLSRLTNISLRGCRPEISLGREETCYR
jgi:hypothetical protein